MAGAILNIAAYRFAPLTDLQALRADLFQEAAERALKGTILLAPEGINLFLAGGEVAVRGFMDRLRRIEGLEALAAKESWSEAVPFGRLRIKVKREIISFRRAEIEPGRRTSPRISPAELRAWLDAGRAVVLLDTRNDYEVEVGTFAGAVTLALGEFTDLPNRLPEGLGKGPAGEPVPIVTFCTGGIRCEKAAPYLESLGHREVYQLDGGILNYFEQVGSAHYTGACWVFDARRAVNPDLSAWRSTEGEMSEALAAEREEAESADECGGS